MFEEPFRWMEAISTRHSYVREKLGKGQPVIGKKLPNKKFGKNTKRNRF